MMTSIDKAKHDSRQEALRAVIEVLNTLDPEAQRKVLETAAVFYEIRPKAVVRGEREYAE